MPFKIIETIERGRRLIVSVPSLWESDGNLYWPKKNVISLKKNENSAPRSDWKCLPCILKRDNILNYKTAEEEITLMSDFTDTDEKENECPRKKSLNTFNFNDLATKCIQKSTITEESSPMLADVNTSSAMVAKCSSSLAVVQEVSSVMLAKESPLMVVGEDTIAVTLVTDSSSLITEEDTSSVRMTVNSHSPEADSSSIMMAESNHLMARDLDNIITQNISQNNMADENLLNLSNSDLRLLAQPADTQVTTEPVSQQTGIIIEILTTVQENQKILFDNQQKLLKGLALLDTKVEEFFVRRGPFQQMQHEDLSHFKIISNIEELRELEKQLTDSQRMATKYFESLSIICSEKKTGYNNAYALVDAMFDRKFMTCCSWGGGTKGEPKHCFKEFSKTINLFLKVVHQYDKTFTKPICEDFFKNVLRHSIKRNSAKRVRSSTMKNKKKKSQVVVNHLLENRPGPSNENNSSQ